jgi:PII-like signaling protein
MTKTRKPRNSTRSAQKIAPVGTVSRRSVLGRIGIGAAGLVALGGAGVWGVGHVQAIQAEHDLSRLGQGVPVVVQVHDPQCPVCNALQDETRAALRGFEESEVLYLIANIRTAEGTDFAARHGVPHVTLLLFDGAGHLRETLRGPQRADALRPAFARLARQG